MDVQFTINGKTYSVPGDIPIDTTLNTFIRNNALLSGTKFMCREGGCGSCIVTVSGVHPVSQKHATWAINSCLQLLLSCDGLDIITVEGIGSLQSGYNPLQETLDNFNGSQCGYCSPGMVMNMYSLLAGASGPVSSLDVEQAFSGNLCRCTGYRSILDAFKCVADEASFGDIEDLVMCNRSGRCYKDEFKICKSVRRDQAQKTLKLQFSDDRLWYKVYSIEDLMEALRADMKHQYMLVAGCTANGVYRRSPEIRLFVDITSIPELRSHSIGAEFIVGANVTLAEFKQLLQNVSLTNGFEYCKYLADHIGKMANVPVRNAGTIAGNLMIKHDHNSFVSDVYLILETIGAVLSIQGLNEPAVKVIAMPSFLALDMNRTVIVNVKLPKLDPQTTLFRSYRISKRAQNCLAYVSAGFLFCFADNRIENARICYAGINGEFMRANATEATLRGRVLHQNETIQAAIRCLDQELKPDWVLPDASPEYRKNLAISLFYKFVLNTSAPGKVRPEFRSGGELLHRPLSNGTQIFQTNKENWPVGKAVTKYDGLLQCSGEAKYINDMIPQPGELWAAFVPAKRVHAKVAQIDATEALRMAGVRYFFSAKDIPGENSFTPVSEFTSEAEELFLGSGTVLYYDQPVGIILADSMEIANNAVGKVRILYLNEVDHRWKLIRSILGESEVKKPVIPTLKDLLELKNQDRIHNSEYKKIHTEDCVSSVEQSTAINGTFYLGSQYHFSMETQTTICLPTESGGLDVYASTYWMDYVQMAITNCLKIPENAINIVVRRLGGSYGCKMSRSAMVACAAALGCHLTRRPVRFVMTLESNMNVIGKRFSLHSEYNIQVDSASGKILNFVNDVTVDGGCSNNDSALILFDNAIGNVYDNSLWSVTAKTVLTDIPTQTLCRAPGTLEATALAENTMEHIAFATGLDPLSVRLANIPTGSPILTMFDSFLVQCDFRARQQAISDYNKNNRWRKRGISIVPMRFPIIFIGSYNAYVTIYHMDGTVAITHGGIDSGQGLNTKMVQVAAFTLGLPMSMISVKPANNLTGANSFTTGGSATTDLVGYSIQKACEELIERLKPLRLAMPDAEWAEITGAAYQQNINLSATYLSPVADHQGYDVCGIACTEVEIDILSGNILLSRVDILEDTGKSLSPFIDIGQIEGAFVMGLGYWLTEELTYDRMTGQLLTDRTTNYIIPGALDIPTDFRVTLWQNNDASPAGILQSKGVGEPAICMSISVMFAIRQALNSARLDAKLPNIWFPLSTSSTPEVIFLAAGNSFADYTL